MLSYSLVQHLLNISPVRPSVGTEVQREGSCLQRVYSVVGERDMWMEKIALTPSIQISVSNTIFQ